MPGCMCSNEILIYWQKNRCCLEASAIKLKLEPESSLNYSEVKQREGARIFLSWFDYLHFKAKERFLSFR